LIPAIWIVIELIRCGYLPLLTGLSVTDKWVLRLHTHLYARTRFRKIK